MNEQLQDALTAFITGLIEFSEHASSAVVSTAPVIVEQLLLYHIAINWVALTIITLIIFLWARAAKKIVNATPKAGESCKYYQWVRYGEKHELRDLAGFTVYAGAVVCFMLLLTLSYIAADLLKLHLAPYVWLIEYAREWL